MKTIFFNYTKKDDSVSVRTLLVMVSPGGDKYAGIDLTSMDPTEAMKFSAKAEKLHEDYINNLQELQALYDLKYNYRQFLVSGMSNIEEI